MKKLSVRLRTILAIALTAMLHPGSAAAQGALYTEAQKRGPDGTTEPPMSDPS